MMQATQFFQPYSINPPSNSPLLTTMTTTSGRSVKKAIKKNKNNEIVSITEYDNWGRVTYYKGTEPEFGDKFEYEYQYDLQGREVYFHDILTGYKFWKTYDHDGNLIMEIDTNGVHEKYELEYYPIAINHFSSVFDGYKEAKFNYEKFDTPQQSFDF